MEPVRSLLIAFRERHGLSRWRLAQHLHMDPRNGSTTIARIERGDVEATHPGLWRRALRDLARELEKEQER